MLEQTQLTGRSLHGFLVEVSVDGALGKLRFEGELMNRLVTILDDIALCNGRAHPGGTSNMVPGKTLPDSFGNIKTQRACDPLQILVRHVVDSDAVPNSH